MLGRVSLSFLLRFSFFLSVPTESLARLAFSSVPPLRGTPYPGDSLPRSSPQAARSREAHQFVPRLPPSALPLPLSSLAQLPSAPRFQSPMLLEDLILPTPLEPVRLHFSHLVLVLLYTESKLNLSKSKLTSTVPPPLSLTVIVINDHFSLPGLSGSNALMGPCPPAPFDMRFVPMSEVSLSPSSSASRLPQLDR